jgi:hypothetical protein
LGTVATNAVLILRSPVKQIETADYNVIFFFPSGTDQNLGQGKGLSEYGQRAHGFAGAKKFSQRDDWGYVCCRLRKAVPVTRSIGKEEIAVKIHLIVVLLCLSGAVVCAAT